MYGEMLKSGWADESKKMAYYDFIVTEGERLSRLIDNVLQLARLNNGGAAVEPVPVSVAEIFDLLRSKLTTQAERAGFALEFEVADTVGALGIAVDTDALTQVFINLVDNAIKFSADADRRTIGIAARRNHAGQVMLTVRDYGPGVPPAALKRLFELFYRPDNELTRTTSGTGIGLALVRQLVTAMGGRVDVRNCEPGAEFRLSFAEASLAAD
jgi:signal transduction histidine kinase